MWRTLQRAAGGFSQASAAGLLLRRLAELYQARGDGAEGLLFVLVDGVVAVKLLLHDTFAIDKHRDRDEWANVRWNGGDFDRGVAIEVAHRVCRPVALHERRHLIRRVIIHTGGHNLKSLRTVVLLHPV